MENFIESTYYNLTIEEETNYIKNINDLLDNYEKHLKLNIADLNQIKLIDASKICELMLNLLLKEKGYLIKKNTSFSQIIKFSTENQIIPQECGKFLDIIRVYRNKVAHDLDTTEELILTFLSAFKYYITWFNDYYPSDSLTNPFRIQPCCSLITSLDNLNKSTPSIIKDMSRRGRKRTRKHDAQDDVFNQDKQTICPECGSTELIGDYERAEVVCAHCGLVIDENLVDMGPEWRAFDHEQRDKRTRVGAPITYTIHDKGPSTMIDWRNKDIYGRDLPARNKAQWYRLRKHQRKIRIVGATERNLAFALSELDRDSSRLGLPRNVREAAIVIYRSVVDNKLIRGRSIESIVAASLYTACRRCNEPRTLDEIAEVSRVTKKEVGRTYRFLTRELNIKLPPTSPVDYVPRFALELGLSDEAQSKAIEIIEKAIQKGLTSGRGPTGVAGAALFIASTIIGERKSQRDIADIAGVTEVTIRNRYKELTEQLEINITLENKPSSTKKSEIQIKQQDIKQVIKQDILLEKLKEQKDLEKTINQDILLEKLKEQNELLIEILKTVLETKELTEKINDKINLITENLDLIQSQTEALIENAASEEEIDRIIQVHTNKCVENIYKYKNDFIKDDAYESEKKKLILSLGESAWNKLSEKSKTFLITSKLMYNKLLLLNEIIDYSGICVLITKAVEVEIYKRFFTNFLKYLDEKYHQNYSKYHTALLFQNTEPLYPNRFTMGNIAFVLCYKENKFDTPQQKKDNKIELIEYCKTCVFSNYSYEEINDLLKLYATKIETIRIKYRNPSAHRNKIDEVSAQECIDLIIDVEKLLKQMLDSFDY